MHLTDNVPTFLASFFSPPYVYCLVGGFILLFGPFIFLGVKARRISKKNATLKAKYEEETRAYNLLSRKEKAIKDTPKAPTYLVAGESVGPYSLAGVAVIIGFFFTAGAMGASSFAPQNKVVSNIQQEAKRVYNLRLTSDEAKQLGFIGKGDTPGNSVLSAKDSRADYIQFGSLATGVKEDGETKVLKITLVKIDGEYKLVYEGKTGLSTVQEIPKA